MLYINTAVQIRRRANGARFLLLSLHDTKVFGQELWTKNLANGLTESQSNEAPAPIVRPLLFRGRGATVRPDGRFESQRREVFDDGWRQEEGEEECDDQLATELIIDTAKSVITENKSPDISFELSINPYRGCEHGCSYCFARPTHSYLGFSSGLDFETKIAYKPDAVALLRKELA